MVDYIADYLEDIRERRVFPDVKPGYIRHLVPDQAPEMGEDWDTIFGDVERVIMPGVSHLLAPEFKSNWYESNLFFYLWEFNMEMVLKFKKINLI